MTAIFHHSHLIFIKQASRNPDKIYLLTTVVGSSSYIVTPALNNQPISLPTKVAQQWNCWRLQWFFYCASFAVCCSLQTSRRSTRSKATCQHLRQMKVFPQHPKFQAAAFPHPRSENRSGSVFQLYSASHIFLIHKMISKFKEDTTIADHLLCLTLKGCRKYEDNEGRRRRNWSRGQVNAVTRQGNSRESMWGGEAGLVIFYYFYRTVFSKLPLSSSSITLELSQNAQFEKLCIPYLRSLN